MKIKIDDATIDRPQVESPGRYWTLDQKEDGTGEYLVLEESDDLIDAMGKVEQADAPLMILDIITNTTEAWAPGMESWGGFSL